MHILNKSKRIVTSTAVGVSAFAAVAAPGAAFAHGWSANGDDNSHSGARQASSVQNHDSNIHQAGNQQLLPCDQQQAALNQKAADAQARYQKQLTGLNIMLSGVQTYVSSGDVTVVNYDDMNTKATADQTNATNAVNAIKAPTLNCVEGTNSVKSSDVSNLNNSFNDSIKAARQAIYTYRQDVNTLFEAVINS